MRAYIELCACAHVAVRVCVCVSVSACSGTCVFVFARARLSLGPCHTRSTATEPVPLITLVIPLAYRWSTAGVPLEYPYRSPLSRFAPLLALDHTSLYKVAPLPPIRYMVPAASITVVCRFRPAHGALDVTRLHVTPAAYISNPRRHTRAFGLSWRIYKYRQSPQ